MVEVFFLAFILIRTCFFIYLSFLGIHVLFRTWFIVWTSYLPVLSIVCLLTTLEHKKGTSFMVLHVKSFLSMLITPSLNLFHILFHHLCNKYFPPHAFVHVHSRGWEDTFIKNVVSVFLTFKSAPPISLPVVPPSPTEILHVSKLYRILTMNFSLLFESINILLLLILFLNLFAMISSPLFSPIYPFLSLLSIPTSFQEVVLVSTWQQAMNEIHALVSHGI